MSREGKKTDEELWLDDGGCNKINKDGGYIEKQYSTFTKVYIDASKTANDRVGVVFTFPDLNIMSNKRISKKLAVFTGGTVVILFGS